MQQTTTPQGAKPYGVDLLTEVDLARLASDGTETEVDTKYSVNTVIEGRSTNDSYSDSSSDSD